MSIYSVPISAAFYYQAEREKPRSLITDITIALQLENGDRRQKTMSCDSTLADMIRMFSLEKE